MCNLSSVTECQTFQKVAYIPVFLLGLLLNTLAVCLFLLRHQHWTDTHIYMLNLALADLALVLFLPIRVYDAYWPLEPSLFCTAMISIHYVNMYASIMTVTCISMHRYLSIRFPFWARRRSSRKMIATLVCALIWMTVVTICVSFSPENYPENLHTCYSRESRLSLAFILVLEIIGYLLPLVILTFCSIWISCALQSKGGGEESFEKKAFVRLVIANLIVFFVCYTPIHMALCLVEYHKASKAGWSSMIYKFREVAEWMATTNCCLDSFGNYFLLRQCMNRSQERADTNAIIQESRHKYTFTVAQTELSDDKA